MAILNSLTCKPIREYSISELKKQANLMRGYALTALCAFLATVERPGS